MSRIIRAGLLLAFTLGGGACIASHDVTEADRNAYADDLNEGQIEGGEMIWYRGERRFASRVGQLLLIEGDIQVAPADMWGPDDATVKTVHEGVGVANAPLKATRWNNVVGPNLQWPGGVVPFQFGTYNNSATGGSLTGAFTAAQQTTVTNAMTTIASFARIVFRPRVAGDANFITFNLSTNCSSRVGRNPGDNESPPGLAAGEQIVRISAGCLPTFSMHHEIGHALGVFHEQTRTDRNTFVQINWQNIQGCNNTATGPTPAQGCGVCNAGNAGLCGCTAAQVNNGTCVMACTAANAQANCGCSAAQIASGACNTYFNFENVSVCNQLGQPLGCDRSNIGFYDYDSIMHYPAAAFSKNGNNTTTTLLPVPPGVAIGNRTHMSQRDAEVLRAMYPLLGVHPVHFRSTGNKPMCVLYGREQDRFGTNFTLPTTTLPGGVSTAGNLQTNNVAVGSYTVDCRATSTFWSSTYALPNTTVPFNGTLAAETYDGATTTVRVLNRGLIAVLFGG